jgi:two-component system NarL family response regulator
LLEQDPNIEVVAEASSGQEILDIALKTEMDVACMDISMPGMDGIETTQRLLAIRPEVRVIGLSAYPDTHYVEAMMAAGAVGYFTKGEADDSLLHAMINSTLERHFFGASISVPEIANTRLATVHEIAPARADVTPLSAKEREVLLLIGKGMAPPQIAHSLSMEPAMCDIYRRNIMRKLRLRDDAALVEYARHTGAA